MSYELTDTLEKKLKDLEVSVMKLRETGTERAETEKNYKIELAKETLKLRDEKMPATLINLMVYGSGKVPELRFKRDVADTIYQANMDAINSLKLQIRVVENQIEREWGQAKRS